MDRILRMKSNSYLVTILFILYIDVKILHLQRMVMR